MRSNHIAIIHTMKNPGSKNRGPPSSGRKPPLKHHDVLGSNKPYCSILTSRIGRREGGQQDYPKVRRTDFVKCKLNKQACEQCHSIFCSPPLSRFQKYTGRCTKHRPPGWRLMRANGNPAKPHAANSVPQTNHDFGGYRVSVHPRFVP